MPHRQDPGDLLQGTLGILILKSLMLGPAHGYAIARWVEETTGDVLKIGVPVAFVLVALLASLIPARRATRVDPVKALRAD